MSTNYDFFYVETHITDHCNLNCASCLHFAPLAPQRFYNLNQFRKELLQLVKINRSEFQFRILGGEPLLHPQFLDFCKVARNILPNSWIGVITNGLLLKSWTQEQFDLFNSLNIELEWSDYLKDPEIREIVENKLNYYSISPHYTMGNMCLDFNSRRTAEQNFESCGMPHCITLRDGYLYRCSTDAWIDFLFNYYNIIPLDYDRTKTRLDIYNCKKEDLNKFANTPIATCRYCKSDDFQEIGFNWKASNKNINEWVANLENTRKIKD